MSAAYRLSPLGCAYYTLVGLTIAFFWFTGVIYHEWHVETAGVWTNAQVVATSRCRDRDGNVLPSAVLTLSFTDAGGMTHRAQTISCEDLRYKVGQSLPVRYLVNDPGYILLKDDIGGGQGFPLIVIVIVDIVCSAVVAGGAVLGIRASRRARSVEQHTEPTAVGALQLRRRAPGQSQLALTHRQRRLLKRDCGWRP